MASHNRRAGARDSYRVFLYAFIAPILLLVQTFRAQGQPSGHAGRLSG